MSKEEIDFKDIVKLQQWYMNVFYEEDNYFPDYRVVGQYNRHIDRVLNNITNNKERQQEIYETIINYTWDSNDISYRPICNALRKLGYRIINNGSDNHE